MGQHDHLLSAPPRQRRPQRTRNHTYLNSSKQTITLSSHPCGGIFHEKDKPLMTRLTDTQIIQTWKRVRLLNHNIKTLKRTLKYEQSLRRNHIISLLLKDPQSVSWNLQERLCPLHITTADSIDEYQQQKNKNK